MYKRGSFFGKGRFFLGLTREGVFCDPDSWRLFLFQHFCKCSVFGRTVTDT